MNIELKESKLNDLFDKWFTDSPEIFVEYLTEDTTWSITEIIYKFLDYLGKDQLIEIKKYINKKLK